VGHGEPDAGKDLVGPLGQPTAQLGTVVVAPAGDQPTGPALQIVQQRHVDPVAGVDHDIGMRHRLPHRGGQIPGALGHVRVRDEQKPHPATLSGGVVRDAASIANQRDQRARYLSAGIG
jgi:hypothetical protein